MPFDIPQKIGLGSKNCADWSESILFAASKGKILRDIKTTKILIWPTSNSTSQSRNKVVEDPKPNSNFHVLELLLFTQQRGMTNFDETFYYFCKVCLL